MTYRILTLNQISARGLERLPPRALRGRRRHRRARCDPGALGRPARHARSPLGVRAIGRAGVGVNNIPVADISRRGVPVFNSPGANANAVKELVLAGLLLAARNIGPAWLFARDLERRRRGHRGGGRAGQEQVRRVRASGAHARGGRTRRGRRRGGQLRPGTRHEGARLRSADHRAARLAAVVERRAGAARSRICSRARMRSPCTCRCNERTQRAGQRGAPARS